MEHLLKAVELAAKYAWASSVAIAFVLFVPTDAAEQLGILPIRIAYLGYFWIGLVASAALFLSSVGPMLNNVVRAGWAQRLERKKTASAKSARRDQVLARMRGLSPDELAILRYCLYYGQQTVFGAAHHPIASALISKKMMIMGAGTVWRVSYTFGDEAWILAQEHTDEFLPAELRERPDVEKIMAAVEKSLKPQIM